MSHTRIPALPASLAEIVRDATWQEVTIGFSGAHVFRVTRLGWATSYLKVTGPPLSDELAAEHDRLAWLHGRLPVPAIQGFAVEGNQTFLLLSEVPGVLACDPSFAGHVPALVRLLAQGLRLLHELDIADCPFDMRLDAQLGRAEERMRAGLVDEDDFDAERQGIAAADLFARLVRERPTSEDLVFTHGDYCLPNILIDPSRERVSGFVDLARAGVADRYQDLALAARSLAYNFGPGWEPLLWEAYGLTQPVDAKIAYYQLLDEFF